MRVPASSRRAYAGLLVAAFTLLPAGAATASDLTRATGTVGTVATTARSAVSPSVAVRATSVARVWLTTGRGAAIPSGSQVRTGDVVRIHVAGFPARTLVTFKLGTGSLPVAVATGGSGRGSALLVVPRSLMSSIYVLGAAGARHSAVVIVYVFNPARAPTPVPGNTVGNLTTSIPSSPTPTPTDDDGDDDDGDDDGDDDDQIPSTGGGTTLPETGANPIDLVLAAVVAFVAGSTFLALGARRSVERPTSRRPAGTRHERTVI